METPQNADIEALILPRGLLAVLAADVAGYSRLSEAAEEETHLKLRAFRVETVDPHIVAHRGRVIRNTGDGFLAVFDSCLDALTCARSIQRELADAQATDAEDRRIRFRMGLNVGDVITEPDDIYGTAVNVAARLEAEAPPGGIVVSRDFLEQVQTRMDVPVEHLGELRLKNMSRRVHAYSLRLEGSVMEVAPPARERAAKRAKVPSIAVLPFRTGGNPEDAYFGEGMVDDIIVELACIRGLLVIAHSSALAYKSGELDLKKVGQDLGVRYVLSGRVRRRENRLRIGAELSDVETGAVVWIDRYDGELAELFDLQDRIAARIVWSLMPHMREAELRRARRKRPQNMNAYDLLLQAIDLLYRMHYADFSRAEALLRAAIAADDRFASAYAYAALWQIHNINQGWTHDIDADSREAETLAAAAVERDPADGFALAIHGHTRAVLFRDYETSIDLFDRALKATPGHAMAWSFSSGVYSYIGESKAAIERAEMGLRLSPVDTQAYFYLVFLEVAHYVNGSYEEAVVWGRKSFGLNPRLCSNLRWLIGSLVALGRLDEARQYAKRMIEIQPRFSLSDYARWCPLKDDLRTEFLGRLRAAGLSD